MVAAILVFGGLFAAGLGWANGANDIANSFGVAVGSNTLSVTKALIIGAIFEFLGAVLTGSSVAKAISKGIVDPETFAADPRGVAMFTAAMFSVLVGTFFWTAFATYKSLPVSITHGVIGSLVGVSLVSLGPESVHWEKVGMTASGWILSPVLGGIFSAFLWVITKKAVFSGDDARSDRMSRMLVPVYVGITMCVLTFFMAAKGPPAVKAAIKEVPGMGIWLPFLIGVISLIVCFALMPTFDKCLKPKGAAVGPDAEKSEELDELAKPKEPASETAPTAEQPEDTSAEAPADDTVATADVHVAVEVSEKPQEKVAAVEKPGEYFFIILVVLSSCVVAFAHGGNDVGNAIGPFSSLLEMEVLNEIVVTPSIPVWVVLGGAAFFSIGVLSYGKNVIGTVGTGITSLTPARAYCAQFGAAISVMIASYLGLPVSTSHTICGSVIAVGLADCAKVEWSKLQRVFLSWIITIPAAMIVSIFVFCLVDYSNYRNGTE